MQDNENTVTEVAEPPGPACRNCGAGLCGEFCYRCGQKESNRDIHFFELVGEFLDDFFVWDSRIWNTLVALLFRPGFVTAEFLAGRKARYLPPVRLYLVISFFMFLLISITSTDGLITIDRELSADERQQAISTLEKRLSDEGLTEEQKNKIRKLSLNHLNKDLVVELDALSADQVPDSGDKEAANLGFWEEGQKPAWAKELEQRLITNVKAVEENPNLFMDEFIELLPYMMFILLPLFAVMVKCAYLFSPFHYLQHLVFSLHYHSAVFLFVILSIALNALTGYKFGIWLLVWSLLYLPLALARVYRSAYASAAGKALLIGFGDAILLLLTLSLLAVISVVTL